MIRDPDHEEYHETMGWLGGQFEPEAFDLDHVNWALHNPERQAHARQVRARQARG